MDIYTEEERNNMIKKAMDNYKYKDLDLKVNELFAINDDFFIYRIIEIPNDKGNRLRISKGLPESVILGYNHRLRHNMYWNMIEDRNLKDFLDCMSNSKYEAVNRYNLYMSLKDCDYNDCIRVILKTLNNIIQSKDKEKNIAIYFYIINNLAWSFVNDIEKLRRYREEITYIKNIIKEFMGGK